MAVTYRRTTATPAVCLQMQQALQTGERTVRDLAALASISVYSVNRYLDSVREVKAVHVADWKNDSRGRPVTAAYRWGNKPDAPRPGPAPSAARMRRLRERRAEA